MTGIITISAATAAYAVEPVKPAQRVTGGNLMEAAVKAWSEQASQSDDPRQQILMDLVRPPALALFFLTAHMMGRSGQTTRQEAEAHYLENMSIPLPELEDSTDEADEKDPQSPHDETSLFMPPV